MTLIIHTPGCFQAFIRADWKHRHVPSIRASIRRNIERIRRGV